MITPYDQEETILTTDRVREGRSEFLDIIVTHMYINIHCYELMRYEVIIAPLFFL